MGEAGHLERMRGWRDDGKRAFWPVKSGRTRGTRDGARVRYGCTIEGNISRLLDGSGRYGERRDLRQRTSLEKGTMR